MVGNVLVWVVLLGVLMADGVRSSQLPSAPITAPEVVLTEEERRSSESVESLEVLSDLYGEIRELQQSPTGEQGAEEIEAAIGRLEEKFDELLAGKDSVAYFGAPPEERTLQEELVEIFDPLIGEVKSATANSREKESLRSQLELLEQRKQAIRSALERINAILVAAGSEQVETAPSLEQELIKRQQLWEERLEQAQLEHETARLQLSQKESKGTNVVESTSRVVAKFFKTRGLHLLIGIITALSVLVGVRFCYHYFSQVSKISHKEHLKGASKTMDGVVHLSSMVAAVFAMLLAFFLCDDWVLLSASLLVLIGVFWALRDKLPSIIEEVRLILNIGAVREGERVIFNDLPYRVEKIRVYSKLVNPELDGGRLRLPISALVGLHSRPCAARDRYFPTSVTNWVVLSDGCFGKVSMQTPEYVEIIQLGGARKVYQTADYLALSPENLSLSQFRISSTFGVDYKHQAGVTDEIPALLQSSIRHKLVRELDDPQGLKKLTVEFASAAASSLDMAILADFDSDLAPKYNVLTRLIQRLAVEACNEYGWEIPFAQLTVHQAGA